MRPIALALIASALAGCGGGLPTRFVLEREIGTWSYRRYQRVLDVEVAIEGNPAVGHTATYVRRSGRGGRVPFATAFVSVYERPGGLAAELYRVARSLGTYEVQVRALAGGWVWHLDGGPGDRWAVWVSQNHVVKVGASEEEERVPDEIVATYMGMYPSDLDEHGRARAGALSAGDAAPSDTPAAVNTQQQQVPRFLQDDAPR